MDAIETVFNECVLSHRKHLREASLNLLASGVVDDKAARNVLLDRAAIEAVMAHDMLQVANQAVQVLQFM